MSKTISLDELNADWVNSDEEESEEDTAEKAAKDATEALKEVLKGEERAEEIGWEDEDMTESQTDRDVNHDEVDESYTEVSGKTPDPENEEGSEGMEDTGTKAYGDEAGIDIGHLEINEYYRVWIKDPEQAPPEVEVRPASEAQAPPPTDNSTHFYEAPFESSVAAVGIDEAAKRLAEYEPDPDFPTKRDIQKSQASESDLFMLKAVESGNTDLVTQSILELAKSPVALFYAAKRTAQDDDMEKLHADITREITRRGIESLDKIKKADPVEATKDIDLNKRKVYVEDESDVPDEYEVEYGPNEGIFYRPDGGEGDTDPEDGEEFREEIEQALTDGDVVDDIPATLWRDLTGQIEDDDLLMKSLDPIQDHGSKTARDRIRQRLRGLGWDADEIDEELADSEGPVEPSSHDTWEEEYVNTTVEDTEPLVEHADAKTGASSHAMEVEELENGTEVFVTNYGYGSGEQDPEAGHRQMATYDTVLALTASQNVPPHVEVGDLDRVSVREFDGEEAWSAPNSWQDEVDHEEYVTETAKQLIAGNNDLHGDNIMVNENGDIAFHDLDHSAGRLDQDDPFNPGDVINGALQNITKTAENIGLVSDRQVFIDEIWEKAQELVEERGDQVRSVANENEDPDRQQFFDNIVRNLEIIANDEVDAEFM